MEIDGKTEGSGAMHVTGRRAQKKKKKIPRWRLGHFVGQVNRGEPHRKSYSAVWWVGEYIFWIFRIIYFCLNSLIKFLILVILSKFHNYPAQTYCCLLIN